MHSPRADRRRRSLLALIPALALLAAVAACAPTQGVAYDTAPFERRRITAVNFDFNSYRIRPGSDALLQNAAIALNDPQLATLHFEINGHTDVTGRLAYNIALSMLRATAIVNDLAARGVSRDRMRPQGFGPLQLLDQENPRSPANRRVEIVAVR